MHMKRLVALFFVCTVLAGCVSHAPRERQPSPVPSATAPMTMSSVAPQALGGEQALQQINSWYNRTDRDCGGASSPAFLCSGVTIRATETNPAFLPWDPAPGSITSGGVSFSWLRTDTNFANLAFTYFNGYIFYPATYVPAGKDGVTVYCAFPMDGDTSGRPSLNGCGPNSTYPGTSAPCENQGILTAAQWNAHFNALPQKYQGQCGWSTRPGTVNSADHFYQAILARQQMAAPWWDIQNEIRLASWATGRGASLPIIAFFYVPGKGGALEKAQNDKGRYKAAYGVDIPIVRLSLPGSRSGRATFAYSESDQGGGPGPAPGKIDFEDVPLQGPTINISTNRFFARTAPGGATLAIQAEDTPGEYMTGRYLMVKRIINSAAVFDLVVPSNSMSFTYRLPYANSQLYFSCNSTTGSTLKFVDPSQVGGSISCIPTNGGKVTGIMFQLASPDDWVGLDNFIIQ